jgi:hypothetical protein
LKEPAVSLSIAKIVVPTPSVVPLSYVPVSEAFGPLILKPALIGPVEEACESKVFYILKSDQI